MLTPSQWTAVLRRHKRIAIVGGPQGGKTTLARTVDDRPIHHNDTAKHLPWEDQPGHWIKQAEGQESFIIEGVHAIRAVRKGLPVDAIVHLNRPHKPRNPGQESMSKGQKTMLDEVAKSNPHIRVYE